MNNKLETLLNDELCCIGLTVFTKDGGFNDSDVYIFDSLKDFISYRKKYHEKMSLKYNYSLLTEDRKIIVSASHYKKFIKLLKNLDLSILEQYGIL